MEQTFMEIEPGAVQIAYGKTHKEINAYIKSGWNVDRAGKTLSAPSGHEYDVEGYLLDGEGNRMETKYGIKYWPETWFKATKESVEASKLGQLVIFHDSLRRAVESPKRVA